MPWIDGKYYTDAEVKAAMDKASRSNSNTENFLTSMAIGAVTGSTIVGGLLGGSFLGGLAGDILEGNDDSWL